MNGLKDILTSLPPTENEKIMTLIMGLVDYYQFHVTRLKELVQDKQQEIFTLQTSTVSSLQSTVSMLREENEKLIDNEREIYRRMEDARQMALEKEKEVCRINMILEEEKKKIFMKRRGEQDWLEEVDKLKRELTAMRELNGLKDEENMYLKKNLRSLEDEIIDLRDQKRELVLKIEKLQSQPLMEEKNSIEKSSKYLVDQINSLKRELFKAKSVVESYKNERETDRHEFAAHREIMKSRRREDLESDRKHPEDSPKADPKDRLNSSFNLEDTSKNFESPKRNTAGTGGRHYSRDDLDRNLNSKPADPSSLGFRRRGNLAERRHEGSHSSIQGVAFPQNTNSQKDLFGESTLTSEAHMAQRRNPNEGSGNIIAADYAEEMKKSRFGRGVNGTRVDSAKKVKLQQDIGSYYSSIFIK